MYEKLKNKESKLSVIGLGYVGLPIALEFAKKISVIGFDIKQDRVDLMKKSIDPSQERVAEDFAGTDIKFTANIEDLSEADFHIVAVPTPIDDHKQPDLTPLITACETVGSILKKGDYVVFESTVYPGCTEEDCIPVLEEKSGLKHKKDFSVGYSPERINPGDKEHTLVKITKVVSACCDTACETVAKVYEMVITAGVHRASSIKVAEASKIIENTQRDVNIALMNELSMIFDKLGINTFEVLEAAGTKWNFLKFSPGLVGGHCIGVDPYYLSYKAKELGYIPKMINSGREINDNVGSHIAKQTVKKIIAKDKNIRNAKVLVHGITFKEDVSDIRNSKVIDVINELESYSINVHVVDPEANKAEVKEEYGLELKDKTDNDYDAIIVAVSHEKYFDFDEKYFMSKSADNGILIDVKGMYRTKKFDKMSYWSL